MPHFNKLLIMAIAMCSLCACRKDLSLPAPPLVTDTLTAVVTGEPGHMNIHSLDTTLRALFPFGHEILELDVDQDGVPDIQFNVSNHISPGSQQRRSWVKCLHSGVSIASYNTNDTVFLHVDTVGTNIHHYSACAAYDSTYGVYSIQTGINHAKYLGPGTLIQYQDSFDLDSALLGSNGGSSMWATADYAYYYSSDDYCHSLPPGITRFLGFRVTKTDGAVRLGWIKLESQGFSEILLFHYAIQN